MSVLKSRELDRNREKEAQKGDEWRERKGLDVMRANIVTEAEQDERGREGEEKQQVRR